MVRITSIVNVILKVIVRVRIRLDVGLGIEIRSRLWL